MLRKALLAFSFLMSGAAHAADYAPIQPEIPPFNWTGIYVGLAAGGGFQETDFRIKEDECKYLNGLCAINHNPDGLAAGGQIYGLWQMQGTGFVIGAEAQGLFADFRDDRDAILGLVKTETTTDALFTAKGQLGWAFDRAYVYGTGGWAWVDRSVEAAVPILGARWSDDQFLDGFVFGAGAKFVVVDGTATQSPSVIFGLEWNRIEVDGTFDNDVQFGRVTKADAGVQNGGYHAPRLKVGADDTIDVITGNVSIKF